MKNVFLALFLTLPSALLFASQDSTAVHIDESVDLAIGPGWPYYYGSNEGVITYWTGNGTREREEFSTPIYMTFTVEKQLKKEENGRFNIGFGFGILNVKSELNYEDQYVTGNQKIRRTYGVIPIYAKYNFIQKEKFRSFISAGVSAEFGINGKIETTEKYPSGYEYVNSDTFPLGLGHANLNSGVGVSYSPFNKVSINAEINASKYLSKGAIWAEKEVWLNIKTGVALRF